MKWVFLAFLLVYTPLLAGWLKGNSRHAPKVWAMLGFLPFVLGPWNLYIAPVSWAYWPGFVKGLELSLLDAVAVAVLVSAPGRGRVTPKWPFLLYIGAVLLSVLVSGVWIASTFYAWQLLRVFVLFAAVATACRDERAPVAIVTGLVLGLCYHAVLAGIDFASGATQAGGALGHQNQLGIISHMVTLPALAFLLAGRRGWMPMAGSVAGIAVAIFTASRATIGLVGVGLVGLFALSVLRRPTSRKAGMALAGAAVLAVAAPLALQSLDRRFQANPVSEDVYDERAAFESAATSMLADNPLGVGANQYVNVANTRGYSDRAGVVWSFGSRSAHVHNVYLLTAAETGYLGLIAFVLMLLCPIVVAFRAAWRFRRDPRGDLVLGLGVSLVVVAVHCFYEWVFVTFLSQYIFGIVAGLIVGVAQQLQSSTARAARRPAVPEAGPLTPALATDQAKGVAAV